MKVKIFNSKTKTLLRLFCLLNLVFFITACDSSDSAHLKVINLSPDVGPIDVFSDDDLIFKAVSYASGSDYNSISTSGRNNSREIRISPTDSFAVLSEQRRSFRSGEDYSLFLFDSGD